MTARTPSTATGGPSDYRSYWCFFSPRNSPGERRKQHRRTCRKGGLVMLPDNSYLVQRLQQPRAGRLAQFGEVFSFGGGLKNGGINDDAMGLLRTVLSFDYMGATEFEWGAVPKALNLIANADLDGFRFSLPLAEVERNWREPNDAQPEGDVTVYVLGPCEWRDEMEARIRELAAGGYRLKESTNLSRALRPVEEYDRDTCGWLELNNGFLFFTDEEMWANVCRLFGVEAAPAALAGAPLPVSSETEEL